MKKSQLRNSLLAVSALSVSIASQLHAVPAVYDSSLSPTSDSWSLPASWTLVSGTPVALVPDTFLGERANILCYEDLLNFPGGGVYAPDYIDYDGGMSTPVSRFGTSLATPGPTVNDNLIAAGASALGAGGLAVANGGLIDINGGYLTQSILHNEIRIGDGVGGVGTGVGTLTIRNGGSFSSGDTSGTGGAIAVIVGGNMATGGSGNGNGTVNIIDGNFLMGDGVPLAGLGAPALLVGAEGSTGVINVGDGIVDVAGPGIPCAIGTATLNLKLNNNLLAIGSTNGFGSTAGTGTVTINSDGEIVMGSGNILVGDTVGGVGTLNVSGGILGQGAATTGNIYIGRNGGTGTFNMTSGVVNTCGDFVIGDAGGAVGVANISGGLFTVGGLLANNGGMTIGHCLGLGSGTLNVSGGATVVSSKGNLWVGRDGGSVGTLNLTSGTVNSAGFTKIGSDGGTGTATISGNLNSTLYITVGQDGSLGTVNQTAGTVTYSQWAAIGVGGGPAGSQWNISGGNITSAAGFEVGSDREGTFNVSGTANVSVGGLEAGIRTGSDGRINVTSGTVVTTRLGIAGAQSGGALGLANISGTANVTINPGGGQSFVGRRGGSTGTLNITGVQVNNVSGQDFQIGFEGGTGNLNVVGGGVLKHNWWLNIARGGTSVGNVTVDGVGSKILLDGNPGPGGGGDINWNVGEDGTGTMTVKNSANVDHDNATSYRSHVGRNNGSHGILNVESGGTVNTMEFFAGTNGGANGVVNINTGGRLTTQDWMEVGSRGGVGTINVDGVGSSLENIGGGDGRNGGAGGDNQIGYDGGTGTVNVTNGGTYATKWWLNIARGGTSTGTVNVDGVGSKVTVGLPAGAGSPRLNVGEDGTGTLSVSNGAGVQMVGDWTRVGANNGSHGLLEVKTGATFTTNNWIVVAAETGSTGTMNISDAGSTVNVNAGGDSGRLITGRLGNATVNQSGGAVNVGNWFAVGIDNGSNGTYNFDGGTLSVQSNIDVGNNGTGTMNITHGNVAGTTIVGNSTNGMVNAFVAGGDSTGNGTININLTNPAGKIVSRELYAGWSSNGVATGSGTINILSGTLQTDGWVEIGRGQANDGNRGTVNVDGPNARWERGTLATSTAGDRGARDMNFGQGENPNFGKGYLNVRNGGTVNQNWWINLARQTGTEGHITVDGAGSTINMVDAHLVGLGGDGNSQLNVGQAGVGTLGITNGGVFNHSMDNGGGEIWISRDGGSTGTMTVDGPGSQFNSKGREFRVGANGTGTLNITNGGVVNFSSTRENGVKADGNFGVAENGVGNATINMNGGQLNVSAWSLFSAWNSAATTATINMTNSVINVTAEPYIDGGGNPGNGGHLFWGDSGTAIINQEGGQINAQGWSAIGRERGGNSTYNLGVSGGGGAMVVGGLGGNELYVGRQSHGTINMGAGTSLTVQNALILGHEGSPNTPSSGVVINNGGTITTNTGEFAVGNGVTGASPNVGLFTQTSGLTTVAGEWQVGNNGSNGVANISGGMVVAKSYVAIGRNTDANGGLNGGNGTVNLSGGTIQKVADNGGTFDIGSWNGGNNATTNTIGTLNQTGGAVINTVSDTHIGRDTGVVGTWNLSAGTATLARLNIGNSGTGTLNMTGGSVSASDRVSIGANGGSTGTANLDGGVLATKFVEAGGGTATFKMDGGTLRALANESDFIRGLTNSGGHSGIKLEGSGGTIDTAGFNVRIKAANVVTSTDALVDGLGGTVLIKDGLGTLAFEPSLSSGFVSVAVLAGTFSAQSPQNLDALFIDSNATYVSDTLGTPPPAPVLVGLQNDDIGDGAGMIAGGASVQGVPEPGTISLLLLSALGMLGRRGRGKKA